MPDLTGATLCLLVLGTVAFIIALALKRQRDTGFPIDSQLEYLLANPAPVVPDKTPWRRNYAETPKGPISLMDACTLLVEAPHIAILGATGDGKTTMGEALLRLLPGPFTVIDPNWVPHKWSDLPCATLDDNGDWGAIEQALHLIDAEISRRRLVARAGSTPATTLTILWDEVNETVEELGETAAGKLRRWLRTARQFGGKLIIFPQSDRVVELGLQGRGDARRHLLWMYVGDDARRMATKNLPPSEARTALELAYPGIIRWHERLYIVDLEGAASLARTPLPTSAGWNPRGGVEQTPAPVPEPQKPMQPGEGKIVRGVDDVDPFTVLARLLEKGIVTAETPLIEAAFACGAGGGVIYQAARDRLQKAKTQVAAQGGVSNASGIESE